MAYKPEEKEDALAVEKYIVEKIRGKAKVVHVVLDLRTEENCKKLVATHVNEYGKLDTNRAFPPHRIINSVFMNLQSS